MIVIERNAGLKLPFSLEGSILDLDHRLMLNLAAYELDDENHIYVCQNRQGCLFCSADGRAESESCYVAEITIPARRYQADRKAVYEGTLPVVVKTAVPFDADRCTLALWALE